MKHATTREDVNRPVLWSSELSSLSKLCISLSVIFMMISVLSLHGLPRERGPLCAFLALIFSESCRHRRLSISQPVRHFLTFNKFWILTVAGTFTTALSAFGFRAAGVGVAEGGSDVVPEGEETEAEEDCVLLIWGFDKN